MTLLLFVYLFYPVSCMSLEKQASFLGLEENYKIQTESERLKIERCLDHVIFKQSSMVSSPCCFAEGGNEMYLICAAPVLHFFF